MVGTALAGDMLKTLVELKANDLLKADARPLVVLYGELCSSASLLTFFRQPRKPRPSR